jgi:hypothetical protein
MSHGTRSPPDLATTRIPEWFAGPTLATPAIECDRCWVKNVAIGEHVMPHFLIYRYSLILGHIPMTVLATTQVMRSAMPMSANDSARCAASAFREIRKRGHAHPEVPRWVRHVGLQIHPINHCDVLINAGLYNMGYVKYDRNSGKTEPDDAKLCDDVQLIAAALLESIG